MFAAFDQLGPVICPSGWYAWLLGEDFADGIPALFASIAEGGGTVNADSVQERVWSALTARYYLDDATDEQVRHLRKITDRDLHRAIGELVALGALAADEANGGTLRLTPLADWAPTRPVRRPGTRRPDRPDQRHAAGHRPAVWRRLLVPANRLDRLDRVIQARRQPGTRGSAGETGPAEPGGRYPRWPAHAPARRKTAAAPPATRNSSTRSPTRTTPDTRTCCDGWASRRASISTRHGLTPPTRRPARLRRRHGHLRPHRLHAAGQTPAATAGRATRHRMPRLVVAAPPIVPSGGCARRSGAWPG